MTNEEKLEAIRPWIDPEERSISFCNKKYFTIRRQSPILQRSLQN